MSTIAAGTSAGTALVSTGDTTGQLVLQTNGTTTAVTIGTNQVVTLAQPLPVASGGTGGSATPTAGGIVYGTGTVQAVTAAGTTGQYLKSNGASAPSWATVSAGFTLGTPVNSTSGTAIDFTGIPAGVKQIVISFITVSTDGSSNPRIQIGDSGGIENTDYVSTSHSFVAATVSVTTSTAGWDIKSASDTNQLSGSVTLTLENSSSNTWAIQGIVAAAGANSTFTLAGTKSLSAVLDRLRITTINGSDAFDLGQINIAYI